MRGVERLHVALARWRLGYDLAEDLPNSCLQALEEGLDSPTLRVLAGMPNLPSWSEVESYLPKLRDELRLPDLTESDAVLTLAADVARRMAHGELDPVAGAKTVERMWLRHVDVHGSDLLQPFAHLSMDWEVQHAGDWDPELLRSEMLREAAVLQRAVEAALKAP